MLRILLVTGVFCMFVNSTTATDLVVNEHPATDVYTPWRLGMQLYTFKEFTVFEALEKTASLGISSVEAYPGQRLTQDDEGPKFGIDMSDKYKKQFQEMLKQKGLKLANFGVVDLPNNEIESRKVFDFAKEMGIETIVSEPSFDAWDLIERLCQEYKINVAIHNHPEPTPYWSPDIVLDVIKDRSKFIGVCADIGHWMRSGIKPIDALQKLEGRIISFHFGDLNKFGDKEAHDVVWGSGVADLEDILDELKRQNFAGVFSVEFEYNWNASVPEIRKSAAFFNQYVSKIMTPEWKSLLDPDLSQWQFPNKSWSYAEGTLSAIEGGDIWSKKQFGNFILDLEFMVEKNTNSGIFIRTGSIEEWLHTAIEVQVLDSHGKKEITKHDCGAIFDCLEPSENRVNKPGEWNRYTITCKDNMIYVVLNGGKIIEMDLNKWKEAHKNPDGTENKFNTAYKDMPRSGFLGLQYHGHPVHYRNIKIKEI